MTPIPSKTLPAVPHRILIVDDNQAIHEDFQKILGKAPVSDFDEEEAAFFGEVATTPEAQVFDLDFASQGKDALEMVRAACAEGRPFSVAFMDVRMPPGWDGIETTARLWEVDPNLQVVICTAYSDYSWEEMIESLGSSDRLLILKKPFDSIEVIQFTHALTGKWSLMQEARRHAESLEDAVQARTMELEASNARLETEIAERRRSEEALRFTQFSVDNASDAMFWIDPSGRLLYANTATCRRLEYSVEELLSMNVGEIVPELDAARWQEFWAELEREGQGTLETEHLTKGNARIPIELNAAFFDFRGRRLVCASARDIGHFKELLGELSKARDAALESVRLKSQFLANMSHEIRTPMNGVIGMADLLLETDLDREQREYAEIIRGSGGQLLNIINDILDSSKIDAGKLEFETFDFNAFEVLEETLDVVANIANRKGIELGGCLRPGVFPHLRGDAGRLRQVLTNIVGNAVKFTDEGGVTVVVSPLEETETHVKLRFEVKDTGIGIDAAARESIFHPFVQADGSDTRRYGGTGLGLSICRQIVEALGGSIGVDSEPGEGATFWFKLTFEKQADRPIEASPQRPQRVLVVDDNQLSRQILQLQLENLGAFPTCVASGEEALEVLRGEGAFDVAVIDMKMPGMSGMDLAARIKADPGLAATRLFILSSLGSHVSEQDLAAAGVEGYLLKPLKQTRFRDALAGAPASPAPEEPAARVETVANVRPLRILLTEDNPVNQQIALLQLRRFGHTAKVACHGAEAVEACEKAEFDLVLMDCQMPVMDGYTATREIRRRRGDAVQIVAMTANAMQGEREKCLAAGMDGYLSKPVRPDDLKRVLEGFQPASSESAPAPTDEEPVNLDWLREMTAGDPAMLRRISSDYLAQAEEILGHLGRAVNAQDAEEIRKLAHKLGGSSSTCGMRELARVLAEMERAPTDARLTRQLHERAMHQLERIRTAFAGLAKESSAPSVPSAPKRRFAAH